MYVKCKKMACLLMFSVVSFMCVVTCYGMSRNEIEDFSNFLEKTSKLDQNLKNVCRPYHLMESDDEDDNASRHEGTGYDDVDEPISDDAWEESGKFEGDLVLNDRQRRAIVEEVAEGLARNGLNDITKRWPDNMLVYYIQREHFNSEQIQAIESGLDDLARVSCVKFRPYRKGDRDAVVIQGSRRGCFSQVGYQGGYQVLNLNSRHPAGRGCFRAGTIVHELLHSLGFYHMQSSPDRDDYIDVKWENIHQPARHNFKKYNSFAVSDFGVGYDYDSVLHYGRKAFSFNGQDTLVPKQDADIGQRLGLSDKDTQKLNKMYCDADSNNNDETHIRKKPTSNNQNTKKKKHKNQPFSGHGIGYHQGKTVAIKIPNSKTIQLVNIPAYYIYDYSRRAHQAVPAKPVIEEFGAGKKVATTFEPIKFDVYAKKKDDSLSTKPEKSNESTMNPSSTLNNLKPVDSNADFNKNKEDTDETVEVNSGSYENFGKEEDPDEDVEQAFNKLKQLFNDESNTGNYYKTNTDYSEFYNPNIKKETFPEKSSVHNIISDKTVLEKNERGEEHDLNLANMEKVRKYINTLHDPNDELKTKKQKDVEIFNTDTVDESYRTSFPSRRPDFKRNEDNPKSEFLNDPSSKLLVQHNYGDLYYPILGTETGLAIKAHKDIFGKSAVPIEDDKWYRRDELRDSPVRYNKDRYTYINPVESDRSLVKLKKNIITDSEEQTPESVDNYEIFGDPVPTDQKWYTVGPLVHDVKHEDTSRTSPMDITSAEHF